jgi:hypothetical protein
MPSSISLSVALFAVVADAAPASKKQAVSALMESAKTLLQNGATPDVVEFASTTLNEITSDIIPAIEAESATDQAFVNQLHLRFQAALDALTQGNTQVFTLNQEEQSLTSQHEQCRSKIFGGDSSEEQMCINKRECETRCSILWGENYALGAIEDPNSYVSIELESVRPAHDAFQNHFCTTNGTVDETRGTSNDLMKVWLAEEVRAVAAKDAYNTCIAGCDATHDALNAKSDICNGLQGQLEAKACEHNTKIVEVMTEFYQAWSQAHSAYSCAVEEIRQLEEDRKREWTTLQVVTCLIDRIHERNGRPCDEETGTVDQQFTECEQRHTIDVCGENGNPQLCLTYEEIPPQPQDCASRTEVVGECKPVQVPQPCCGIWEGEQYDHMLTHADTADTQGKLREWPAAPFAYNNPGCNAWADCSACPHLPYPTMPTLETCPGYTTDDCMSDDEEDHPLRFPRDVDFTAAVLCCGENGACDTTESVFEGTYLQAMDTCHERNMRVCRQEEVSNCCRSTSQAVWVDIGQDQTNTHYLDSSQHGEYDDHSNALPEIYHPTQMINNWNFAEMTVNGAATTLQVGTYILFTGAGNSGLSNTSIPGWHFAGNGSRFGLLNPRSFDAAEGYHVLALNSGDDANYVWQDLLQPFTADIHIEAAVGGSSVADGGYRMGLYTQSGALVAEVSAGVNGAPNTAANGQWILTHLNVRTADHQDVVGETLQLRLKKNKSQQGFYHYIRFT